MTQPSRMNGYGRVLLGALALVGCEVPRTQLLVGVDAELSWGEGQALESVVLEVRRGDANGLLRSRRVSALGTGPGRLALPLWVTVLSGDDDDRSPVWLEALGCARADGCTRETAVVAQRATVSFVRGSAATVTLLLAGVCAGRSCALSERCAVDTGRCIDANAQEEVVPFTEGLPQRGADSGSASMDAAVDALVETGLDAAPDRDGSTDVSRDRGFPVPTDTGPGDSGSDSGCSSATSCAACTAIRTCGWCTAMGRCSEGTSSGPRGTTCAVGWAWQSGSCGATPSDPCRTATQCGDCTARSGCGWCVSTRQCLTGTATGSPLCPTSENNWAWLRAQCVGPTDPCRTSTGCGSCTNRGSCGWCLDSNTCHTGTSSGPSNGACRAAQWRWQNTLGTCL